ncbi:hypothetical protein ACHQM5_020661 [Ranunculus cassubicifolius]
MHLQVLIMFATCEKVSLRLDYTLTARQDPIQCSWFRLPEDILKINADCSVGDTRSGYGGVQGIIREEQYLHTLHWRLTVNQCYYKNLRGIEQGMLEGVWIGYKKLHVVSDSLNAVSPLLN